MIIIFILIYLISFIIHLLLEYKENKWFIHDVGDLIDNIKFYMWFPLLNTIILIVILLGDFIIKLQELLRTVVLSDFIIKLRKLLKLDILLKKFRNIKLR